MSDHDACHITALESVTCARGMRGCGIFHADPINHPSHYTSHPSGVECIQVTEHMNFCLGNAVKYIWRAGLKRDASLDSHNKALEDLKKARWYVDREIARLEKAWPKKT